MHARPARLKRTVRRRGREGDDAEHQPHPVDAGRRRSMSSRQTRRPVSRGVTEDRTAVAVTVTVVFVGCGE